jgi:hypothetical protein
MFMQFSPSETTLLGGGGESKFGDGMTTDGYFGALSRQAVVKMFALVSQFKSESKTSSIWWHGYFQVGIVVRTKNKSRRGMIIDMVLEKGGTVAAKVMFGKVARVVALDDLALPKPRRRLGPGRPKDKGTRHILLLHNCARLLSGHGANDGEEGTCKST